MHIFTAPYTPSPDDPFDTIQDSLLLSDIILILSPQLFPFPVCTPNTYMTHSDKSALHFVTGNQDLTYLQATHKNALEAHLYTKTKTVSIETSLGRLWN